MISTIFLGIDHWYGGGAPVLFETMVFGGRYDQHQLRYTSWDAAKAGHVRVVAMVKASAMCDRLKKAAQNDAYNKVFKCQRIKVGVTGKIVLT